MSAEYILVLNRIGNDLKKAKKLISKFHDPDGTSKCFGCGKREKNWNIGMMELKGKGDVLICRNCFKKLAKVRK